MTSVPGGRTAVTRVPSGLGGPWPAQVWPPRGTGRLRGEQTPHHSPLLPSSSEAKQNRFLFSSVSVSECDWKRNGAGRGNPTLARTASREGIFDEAESCEEGAEAVTITDTSAQMPQKKEVGLCKEPLYYFLALQFH